MNQPGNAMALRSVDAEIRIRLPRTDDLGPDAGIVRHQRNIRHARPPMADRARKPVRPRRIDGQSHRIIHPFDVGAEPRLPRQIEGQGVRPARPPPGRDRSNG